MDNQTLNEKIFCLVAQQSNAEQDALTLDTPLGVDGLCIDSIGILELLLKIETETGLQLRDECLTEDALSTIGGLATYIKSLQIA